MYVYFFIKKKEKEEEELLHVTVQNHLQLKMRFQSTFELACLSFQMRRFS